MVLSKRLFVCLSLLFFFGLSALSASGRDATSYTIPLPLNEVSASIRQWLSQKEYGFVERANFNGGERFNVSLEGSVHYAIVLRHRTSLGTIVSVEPIGPNAATEIAGLRDHLDEHLSAAEELEQLSMSRVPFSVEKFVDAVIRVQADKMGKKINLTGFAVTEDGYFLCTAHDLQENQQVTILSSAGQSIAGEVVALNPLLDLALIKGERPAAAIIPAALEITSPDPTGAIYAISFSEAGDAVINSSHADKLAREMNGALLWQVNLKVRQGDSGSPVLDSRGNLVGVIKGRFLGTPDIAFLIPSVTVADFLRESMQ